VRVTAHALILRYRLEMLRLAAAVSCALFVPGPVAAQESRTAILEQERAEKASRVQPYRPGRIERALLYVERENPMQKISPYNGFFLEYGYAFKPVGSGVGIGGGFRHDLFDRRARLLLEGGITLRNYQLLRADFSLPSLAADHLELGIQVSDRHNPQEDFWGLGPSSARSDRVSFLLDQQELEARAVAKPVRGLRVGLRGGVARPEIGSGTDARFPSIETLFTDNEAPGLDEQPEFGYGEIFTTFDYRDQPGNPRSGGFYGAAFRSSADRDLDRYDFDRLDVELQQFVPIFDKKRVIALRGRLTSTSAPAGHDVPFYAQPTLGGSDTLRSVRDFRFRDRHVLTMNAEYRWEAFSGLDMALFSDWGDIGPHRSDLDFRDLKHAYGIGFRFNTFKSVFLRVDVATGAGESVSYFVKFSGAF